MGRPRVVVLDDYQGVALRFGAWDRLGDRCAVTALRDHLDGEDLVAALAGATAAVAMRERTSFDAALLDQLPDLRLLTTTAMSNASIDIAVATRNDVVVCGTRHLDTPAVEQAWALILALRGPCPRRTRGCWTVLSPHVGYVTERNCATYFGDVVENIAAFLDGEPVRRLPTAGA